MTPWTERRGVLTHRVGSDAALATEFVHAFLEQAPERLAQACAEDLVTAGEMRPQLERAGLGDGRSAPADLWRRPMDTMMVLMKGS